MPDSLLIGKNKNRNSETPSEEGNSFNELFDSAFNLLLTNQYPQAYQLLQKANKQQKHVAALFNLALCYIQANDYNAASTCLDEAHSELKRISLPTDELLQNSTTQSLTSKQAQADYYKQPMAKCYPQLFKTNGEERILRLKVDVYVQLALWQKIIEVGQQLSGKNFANVNAALSLAQSKLGI